jgi:XTP/dITP diphosphohydrolase
MTTVVVATRSHHKLSEIREILPPLPATHLIDLEDAGIPADPAEDQIEIFDSFEENALAKARYYARFGAEIVLADDSGLCVDALGGAPGVRSKRFSGRTDLIGLELDHSNNRYLLDRLEGVPHHSRTAHYVCAIAIVNSQGRERIFRGTVDGLILTEARGTEGFGYDPLFFVPELGRTFAQVPAARKHEYSHRARALQSAVPYLREAVSHPPDRVDTSP